MISEIEKKFKNPPPEFRSACFWAWNGKLEAGELEFQLGEMKKGGQQGGFMHSREGLITEYFSKEWFDCVRTSARRAKELGIPVYLYDEDRWPSGFAGGDVTKKRRNAMKVLRVRPGGEKKVITLPPIEYFNGAAYLDTLSEKPVGAFIESAYETYRRETGEEFGGALPAVFTDEPNLFFPMGAEPGNYYFPWTRGFGAIFRKRYGYDILENIELLYEQKEDYMKVRYDYRKLLAELFALNFGKQVYDWCDRNGIMLTGHYNAEDSIASQVDQLGAAMPLYEYMHVPGVDHLWRQVESVFLTIKQCSSVANQTGRERVLSELFGCSGQNMSFEDRKWIGDWNIVLGVNFLCPHLWLYSLAGERKRDYPPTISFHQPWWRHNKAIEDYFARLCCVLSRGKFHASIIVIHPVESGWCLYGPESKKPVEILDKRFRSALKRLACGHYGFDLGDEGLISRLGGISKDRGKTVLNCGRAAYELVVVPPVKTLRASTVELIGEFIARGGKVITMGGVPERVDGVKKGSEGLERIYREGSARIRADGTGLLEAVGKSTARDVSIIDGEGEEISCIFCRKSVNRGWEFYFMANTCRETSRRAVVRINGDKNDVVEVWNPWTGEISEVNRVVHSGGEISFEVLFPPAGSLLAVKRKKKRRRKIRPAHFQPEPENLKTTIGLPGRGWKLKKKGPNALVLDMCRLRAGYSSRWGPEKYVLDVQGDAEKRLKNGDPFGVKYVFYTDFSRAPGSIELAVERADDYKIFVNGRQVNPSERWLDPDIKKADIAPFVKKTGKNTVVLIGKFRFPRKPGTRIYTEGGTEIEAVYVLGDFLVPGKFWKARGGYFGKDFYLADSGVPRPEDAVRSGYPFYAGEFRFSTEFDFNPENGRRYFISFDGLCATAAEVALNGVLAGAVTCAPYMSDVSGLLKPGGNRIEVTITGSLRNLLGPHHWTEIQPLWTGPGSFRKHGGKWTGEYGLVPFGMSPACILEG